MKSIAKLLKDTREDLDLSQIDIMKKTGINNKSLSRYENDMTEPDIKTLGVLFRLYGLSLDEALGLKNTMYSAEEKKLIGELRELPEEFRTMIFKETETLYSHISNNKK